MVHSDVKMTKVLYPRAALGSSQIDWETGQEKLGEKCHPSCVVACHTLSLDSDPQLRKLQSINYVVLFCGSNMRRSFLNIGSFYLK